MALQGIRFNLDCSFMYFVQEYQLLLLFSLIPLSFASAGLNSVVARFPFHSLGGRLGAVYSTV
jgi:hypothetical protein